MSDYQLLLIGTSLGHRIKPIRYIGTKMLPDKDASAAFLSWTKMPMASLSRMKMQPRHLYPTKQLWDKRVSKAHFHPFTVCITEKCAQSPGKTFSSHFLSYFSSHFFSTAESGQLCYTNRCGVVVVGVVIIVSGVVNFLNFDLTIGCLPLI